MIDMDDIARIRNELKQLLNSLSKIYLKEAMQQESDELPGGNTITVNFSGFGFQSRKGVMRESSDSNMYSIEIPPSMSIDDLKNSIFRHVKCQPPDLSKFDMKLIFRENYIETNGKVTVEELNLVHQWLYCVELVLKDQPRGRITATEAKKCHEERIKKRKQDIIKKE